MGPTRCLIISVELVRPRRARRIARFCGSAGFKAMFILSVMFIIGDVHGKIEKYHNLVKGCEASVQLGDFGLQREHDWHLSNIDHEKHQVLFGNHDFYPYLRFPHSLTPDYELRGDILFVRGANSIDKHLRTEGDDWFPNEEIDYATFSDLVSEITTMKPEIIISHDCPKFLYQTFFGIDGKSRTNQGLQACFEAFQPKMWVFGHHHKSKDEIIEGTRFICLAELEALFI